VPFIEGFIGLAIGELDVLDIDVVCDGLVHGRNELSDLEDLRLALHHELQLVEQLLGRVERVGVGRESNQLNAPRSQ
jgi:hypothetical protein